MSLKDLGEISTATQKRIESIPFKDILLPEDFKIEYKNFVTQNSPDGYQSVEWSRYTACITTSSRKIIYLPNFWFFTASQLAHLIDALEQHKKVFLAIFSKPSDDKNDIANSLRNDNEKTEAYKERITEFFANSKYTPEDKVNFVNFVTDYKVWGGGKTIDRGDYFVSPLMKAGNLLAETQSAIAEIAMHLATHQNLWDLLDKDVLALNSTSETTFSESLSTDKLIKHLHSATERVNLTFLADQLASFVAAQATKPFVILTGLSGSGKTKLAEATAYWLSEDPEKQVCMVAVGADWTNNEPLLGYADAINQGRYCVPASGILQLLDHAQKTPKAPHFLILDEMNLSHVERYFADFLSAMESSEPEIALHGQGALKAGELNVPARLTLPPNVFIIGTVNVDETTYMFSPKVLDRANVIEFRVSTDQMRDFLANPTKSVSVKDIAGEGAHYAEAFVARAQLDAALDATVMSQLQQDLIELFEPLAKVGAEFGYRSAKEIARFVAIHRELSGADWNYKDALDAQVMQKLMPKLHGSARKLSGVLNTLEKFALEHNLPLTQDKVKRMQKRLKNEGFTSFAEN